MAITLVYTPKNLVKREKPLNKQQMAFCEVFAKKPDIMGSATEAYKLVYGVSHEIAKTAGNRLLKDPRVVAQINAFLSEEGFNDENVDKQHLFIINQHKDLNVKMKGIEHYNRLKKRIENKMEIVMPKPIIDLDDDEVIHKIDKSKAKEIRQDDNNVSQLSIKNEETD